jgi:hypothetical protein
MVEEVGFFINNTVNASLGPSTPRDFAPAFFANKLILTWRLISLIP